MDQLEYKRLTKSNNVFSISVLEETIEVLRPEQGRIADKLQAIIAEGPIEKPEKHTGGRENDFFLVQLEQQELESIVEKFGDLEVAHVSAEGNTTSEASHYASMLDLWSNAT